MTTTLAFYYRDEEVQLQEEYLIFDFSNIVVSAGGSLGLFLGFSFYQFGQAMMEKILDLQKRFLTKP